MPGKIIKNTGGMPRKALLEELEAERAITHFATSLIGQATTEEVLWDVARNCIVRLGLVDCVVYWLDEERGVLVQKAAHGTLHPVHSPVAQPLEIPVGKGPVGGVALSGQAEIVRNAAREGNHARHDRLRYSAITVPIVLEGKVVGVINAKHPEKNFFRPRHLRVLTAIAALCAQKIQRVAAEEAYRQVERKLLETSQRAAETKLIALRMQMSPHFIFNSLSSVNHFILQKDAEQASALLTKFSRLLRQVMENVKTEWVLLRRELDALQIYVELEQLRCDHCFEASLDMSGEVNPDAVLLPPLLLHPFVENAIWHGLLHQKNGKPRLQVNCWLDGGYLMLRVRDNGIGRAASRNLYRNELTGHKVHGIKSTRERLDIVNQVFGAKAEVQIEDLFDAEGGPAGTSVTITMQLQQPWQPFE
jgi:LytS/YehU family sensor histidine kinase